MNKFRLLVYFILLSLSSCSSLFLQKALFGVRNPKVKSEMEIKSFLTKNDFDTNNLYFLDPMAYVALVGKDSKYFATWEVFNQNGELVIPENDSTYQCIANIEYFIQNFNLNSCKVDSSRNLENDLTHHFLNSKRLKQTDENHKLFLVLYWSTFMGKYSTDILGLESIAIQSEAKFTTYKVNMDLRTDIDDFEINLKKEKSP